MESKGRGSRFLVWVHCHAQCIANAQYIAVLVQKWPLIWPKLVQMHFCTHYASPHVSRVLTFLFNYLPLHRVFRSDVFQSCALLKLLIVVVMNFVGGPGGKGAYGADNPHPAGWGN